MTILRFIDEVYVPLRLRGRSAESVRLLKHAANQFGRWLGRTAMLEDFDDLVVSQFLLARSQKLAPDSVARERSGLLAIWNLAQARGLVRLRPCVAAELIPEKTPRAFSEAELARLIASCAEARGWVGPIPAGLWFVTLASTLFYSGERITALLNTPKECWKRPWLVVPYGVRKGRRKERCYELPPYVGDWLDKASKHDGPFLLWWPCSGTALRKRWRKITARAGLGEGRDVQFHALRKSTASHLAAAGGSAKDYLGHSSDRVTAKYIDPRIAGEGNGKTKAWQLLPKIV